jgi:hypothetical protein
MKPEWATDKINGTNDLVYEITEMVETLIDWAKADCEYSKQKNYENELFSASKRLNALLKIKELVTEIEK